METKQILIKNALLLTMNSERQVYNSGSLLLEGDTILKLSPDDINCPDDNVEIIDARGGIVMPGMINTHTHLGMSFFRSLADDQKDRLRRVLFPLEKEIVSDDLVYWASLHSYTEMIQGGVTTLFDMYYFEDAVARAADQAGVRSILGETVVDFPSPDSPLDYGGIDYARDFIRKWKNHKLITPAVAPHAPYTVDDLHLKKCYELACSEDVPLTIHLSEMPFEMKQFHEKYNKSPVAYLDDLGILDSRMVAAHCIFTSEEDRAILKKRDVGVAHNMVANIKGAKGVAAVPEMLAAGIRVGLGSDGPMSGNTQDIISLMGTVSKVHKLNTLNPQSMPPRQVVEMATIGGAGALHREDSIGSLEEGKKADIVIFNHDSPAMFPVYDPYSTLVYSASPRDVDTVLINGRIVMKNRIIPHLDMREIREAGQEYFEKVCSLPVLKDLGLHSRFS